MTRDDEIRSVLIDTADALKRDVWEHGASLRDIAERTRQVMALAVAEIDDRVRMSDSTTSEATTEDDAECLADLAPGSGSPALNIATASE